jgi:two-component system, NtrC family, response regulator GlrR
VLRLQLPPLRARREDIELLAQSALQDCSAVLDHPPKSLSPAALRLLASYDWPGNVRELANVVQRAAVACGGEQILPAHLSLPGIATGLTDSSGGGSFRRERATVVAAFERQYVEDMLRKHDGNVTHAAREAKQNRRVFGRFMKKYKIDRRVLKA